MKKELKEAFRIYDKEGTFKNSCERLEITRPSRKAMIYYLAHCLSQGNGYISTDTLKEILKELDNKLTEEDLIGIIEEVDEDGSGTLDFDGQ